MKNALLVAGISAGSAGVHGNNRLGGNSLLDCVVFGRVAGKHAALYMLGESNPTSLAEISGALKTGGAAASGDAGGEAAAGGAAVAAAAQFSLDDVPARWLPSYCSSIPIEFLENSPTEMMPNSGGLADLKL